MRSNLENSQMYNPRISGLAFNNVNLVLTGTLVIPDDGPTVWVADGGLLDRTVRLPQLFRERQVVIANVGTSNSLFVTDSSGAALTTLIPSSVSVFFAGTSRWVWYTSAFNVAPITTTLYTTSSAVLVTDSIVQVNGAGAVVLTLPTSASWQTITGPRGLPLSIFDISGNASVNNITINPNGAETISGMANVVIDSNYGGFRLRPKATGNGWVVV